VDLDRGIIRVARSYSTGRYLGPTKSGRERVVELTTRLQRLLRDCRPNIFGDEALVCPGEDGGFLEVSAWRRRVFAKIASKVLGRGRTVTPHTLRHTYASIHLTRGTNLLWVQRQGGWQSPAVLLSTYAHFLPSELAGFADVLTAQNGPIRPQPGETAPVAVA
jgi:integrase